MIRRVFAPIRTLKGVRIMKAYGFEEFESVIPETTEEKFFNAIDKLIYDRSLGWRPEFLENDAVKIGDLGRELFVEWLKREGSDEDGFDSASYVVLPYLSYRLLNPGVRAGLRLDRCTPKRMDELIDLLAEEIRVNPKDKIYRAVTKSSIEMFLQCLSELYLRREQ